MQNRDDARTMSVPEFSKNVQKVVDGIAASGREIVLTRDGKPVARLVGCENAPNKSLSPTDSDWSNEE